MCRLYNNQEMRPAAAKQMTKCISANVARLLGPENPKPLESNSDVESMIVQANIKVYWFSVNVVFRGAG
jgi:predicted acetyltransferase